MILCCGWCGGEAACEPGIDDWAFRRHHPYGTIVCDLERRRIVTLLPDREIATVQAWLTDNQKIGIIARDPGRRSLASHEERKFGLPGCRPEIDGSIRAAIGATKVDPDLLTCAEKLQFEGHLRRKETNAVIMRLAGEGAPSRMVCAEAATAASSSAR